MLDRGAFRNVHRRSVFRGEPASQRPVLFARAPARWRITRESLERRWQSLAARVGSRAALLDPQTLECAACYQRNIENFIGTVKLPVGLAGPLPVNGLFARGEYLIPLATTEAALVASFHRGAQLIREAGGCDAMLLREGIGRAPGFTFRSLREATWFAAWADSQQGAFRRCAESTTCHGKLTDMQITVEGNHVFLNFEFTTGEAAGQNMVTIATESICAFIRDHSPVRPQFGAVEANHSGDKKASARSFLSVRGKKVSADVTLSARLVARHLDTTPARMLDYWRLSATGGLLSGTLGIQGQYANALAALYIACGQDAACVAESAVGVTRLEATETGDLYAAVTLPSVVVGTVGGGTDLPSQRACLQILGLEGPDSARALAEICAALALAGELSIIGALAAGTFSRAHRCLARTGMPSANRTESGRG